MDKNYNHGWYGKVRIASVTFKLEHAHKISQPKDLLRLAHDLYYYVAEHVDHDEEAYAWLYHAFDPDGASTDDLTGIINIYLPAQYTIKPEDERKYREFETKHKEIMAEWYQLLEQVKEANLSPEEAAKVTQDLDRKLEPVLHALQNGMARLRRFFVRNDVDIKLLQTAISKWMDEHELLGYEFEIDFNNLQQDRVREAMAWRLRVTQNPSESFTKLPELNVSNGKAEMIFKLLGIGAEYLDGSMNAKQLLDLLNRVSDQDLEMKFRAIPNYTPEQIQQSVDMVKETLQTLHNLCNYAIQNNFANIVWN